MNFISKKNTFIIKGKTSILHSKRVSFGLTCDEYVLLDTMHEIITSESKSEIDTLKIFPLVYEKIGFSIDEFKTIGKSLVKKGLLERTLTGNTYTIKNSWIGVSKVQIDSSFEAIWISYGKVGNKAKAKIMFQRALKETKLEHLQERIKLYLLFLAESGQIQMHLSSFLNPEFKQYDNDFTIKLKRKPDEQKQTVNIMDENRRVNR